MQFSLCYPVCCKQNSPIGPRPPPFRGFRDHTWYETFERVISPSQTPLPHNTQHSKETDIHAPGGVRTRSLASEQP